MPPSYRINNFPLVASLVAVMTLAGPSPADNSSSTQDPTEIDLLGGVDNACTSDGKGGGGGAGVLTSITNNLPLAASLIVVLGLFKSLEHCFDIEHRKEFDSLTRERDVYKEMHEAGVKERQDLERRILTAENQLVTEKNKSKEQLSLYDGSLGIGNPERIVVEDDRALIEVSDGRVAGAKRQHIAYQKHSARRFVPLHCPHD